MQAGHSILDSHSNHHENYSISGCEAVQSSRNLLTYGGTSQKTAIFKV
jgi:hypothetical protein